METHYMDCHTRLPTYYPLPLFLFEMDLSGTAKLLYAVLLNRVPLSQKNEWIDESGHVYIVYSIEEIAQTMHKGTTAIKNALRELDGCDLLKRVKNGFGKANHLYLKIPEDVQLVGNPPVKESEKRLIDGRKTDHQKDGNQPPNYYTKLLYNNNRRDIRMMDYSYKEGESL